MSDLYAKFSFSSRRCAFSGNSDTSGQLEWDNEPFQKRLKPSKSVTNVTKSDKMVFHVLETEEDAQGFFWG